MKDPLKNWIKTREIEELNNINENLLMLNIEHKEDFIFQRILYEFSFNEQLKNYNNDTLKFIKNKLLQIEKLLGKERFLNLIIKNFKLVILTYEKLLALEERMELMEKFRGSEETKAKIFSISIYNDLLNSAYSYLLELFIEIESNIENKLLYQKSLTSKIQCLSTRGYTSITSEVLDSNIRNSISHGGESFYRDKIIFKYKIGSEYRSQEKFIYEFTLKLKEMFDITSSMCLSIFLYLYERNVNTNLFFYDNEDSDCHEFIRKMQMSSIMIKCNHIYNFHPMGNQEEIQCNIELVHPDIDIKSRYEFALNLGIEIIQVMNLGKKDYIFFLFKSKHSMNSFLKIKVELLLDIYFDNIPYRDVINILKKDSLMWEVNNEERNDIEDLFRYYENIENENFKISEILDISLENCKRFKCNMYLKKEIKKFCIKKFVEDAVKDIKILKNYGFSTNKVKHGDVEADIIYISVYKKDLRRGEKRNWNPENDNFICNVQYDINKKFSIYNNLIDSKLKPERKGNIEYRWNPNFR